MCQSDQLMVWIECAEAVIHVLNNNFFLGYDSLPRYYRSSQCAKNTKKKMRSEMKEVKNIANVASIWSCKTMTKTPKSLTPIIQLIWFEVSGF